MSNKFHFLFITITTITLILCQNEEEMIKMAKASACMAISRNDIENNKIENKQEIFEGLANCYFTISETQLMNLVQMLRDGVTNFKNTEFESLTKGRNFIKNFPDENERRKKIIEFQSSLEQLRKAQENINRGEGNYEGGNNSPNIGKGFIGGFKYFLFKGIFSIVDIVNGYVLTGILMVLGFFTLRSCSKMCKKGKKINKKDLKEKKNVEDNKNDNNKDNNKEKEE